VAGDAVTVAELVPDEQVWITLTMRGLLSRTLSDQMPKVTQDVKDPPRLVFPAGVSEIIYLFTSDGMAATIPVHQIPQTNDLEAGAPYSGIAPVAADQTVVAALPRGPVDDGYLFLGTTGGMVKRIEVADLPGLSARSFRVIGLTGDSLGWVAWTDGSNEIMRISAEGKAIRFPEEDVRPMGLPAGGVAGMELASADDAVAEMMVVQPDAAVCVVTTTGRAKWSPVDEFPLQGRYGQGVIAINMDPAARVAAAAIGVPDDPLTIVTSRSKHRSMRLGLVPRQVRNAPGVASVSVGPNERVVRIVAPNSRTIRVPDAASESPVAVADDRDASVAGG
jgi:DNA gyrase subunit A